MSFLAPRIASGIGVAMARVATRFYFFGILLVGSTIFLPRPTPVSLPGMIILAVSAIAMMLFLSKFPWDSYEPRVFTVSHLVSSSLIVAFLVYLTGGLNSNYDILFFLIILFSYFYNLKEMFFITTVIAAFYLLPYSYGKPDPHHITASIVMIMFFYLGTYILYGITRFVLKKNSDLEDLNGKLSELYSITANTLTDMEKEAILETLSERLKDHLPSTYCFVMLYDDKLNLIMRIACPIRSLAWEPAIGALYPPDRLPNVRSALENRQPRTIRLETEPVDDDLKMLITKHTRSVLIVPVRIGAENIGAVIFGEERHWIRSPFSNEKIQLAVAISKQVAIGVNLWWCYERLIEARHELQVSHDKVIKAERLATLGEVTKAVEHEINNPLNVIVNWAEIYREDESIGAELRNKFEIIYDMALRIRTVVQKLKDMKETKSIEFMKGQKMTDIG